MEPFIHVILGAHSRHQVKQAWLEPLKATIAKIRERKNEPLVVMEDSGGAPGDSSPEVIRQLLKNLGAMRGKEKERFIRESKKRYERIKKGENFLRDHPLVEEIMGPELVKVYDFLAAQKIETIPESIDPDQLKKGTEINVMLQKSQKAFLSGKPEDAIQLGIQHLNELVQTSIQRDTELVQLIKKLSKKKGLEIVVLRGTGHRAVYHMLKKELPKAKIKRFYHGKNTSEPRFHAASVKIFGSGALDLFNREFYQRLIERYPRERFEQLMLQEQAYLLLGDTLSLSGSTNQKARKDAHRIASKLSREDLIELSRHLGSTSHWKKAGIQWIKQHPLGGPLLKKALKQHGINTS